jgi:cytochrome b6-f complex iron-sulfur subunit
VEREALADNPAGRRRGVHRRHFLLGVGWGGLALLVGAALPGLLRFLGLRERVDGQSSVEVGPLQDYRASTVTTRWVGRHGMWLVLRDARLFALEARCTHLGCTTRWIPESDVFQCPCHGSRFSPEGVALNGPATQPLRRLAIRLERGVVVVDRFRQARMEEAERDPRFFIQT